MSEAGATEPAAGRGCPQRVLAGRYQLIRFIACGGMAEVWEGRDALLARPVAIKMPLPHVARQEQAMHRFRREAVAAARLSHPNVVAVFDTGTDGADSFIIMELVDGLSLDQLLERAGPLELGRAVSIAAQVAGALEFACRAGIVHRDVKPANVLVTGDGVAKVTDFGIAKAVLDEALTEANATVGTARYIAPEQVEGLPTDGRTDVYALGVVLYEMLCGCPPFRADNDLAVALMHLRDAPPPPSTLRPGTPPWLEQVVLQALAKDPSGRYDSAGQLRSALLGPARDLPLPPAPAPGFPASSPPPGDPSPPGDLAPAVDPSPAMDLPVPAGGSMPFGPPPAPEDDPEPGAPSSLTTGSTALTMGDAATVSFTSVAMTGQVAAGRPDARLAVSGAVTGRPRTGPTTAGPTTAGPTTAGPTTAGPTTAGPTTAAGSTRTVAAPDQDGGGPTHDRAGIRRRHEQGPTGTGTGIRAPAGGKGRGPDERAAGRKGQEPGPGSADRLRWADRPGSADRPRWVDRPGSAHRRGAGAGRRRRRLPMVVAAVAAAAVAVALVLVFKLGPGRHAAPPQGSPAPAAQTGTPAPSTRAVAVAGATSFDPYGDGSEDPGEVGNLYDGNPATSWHTDHYYGRGFAGLKPGVGFVLRLARPTALRALTLDTTTPGWRASVYVSGESHPALAGWGSPVARVTADQARVVAPLGGHTGSDVLVWFTGLGPAQEAVIGEASLTS